jgi:hypothetical protein
MSSITELQELEKDIQSQFRHYHHSPTERADLEHQLKGIQQALAIKQQSQAHRAKFHNKSIPTEETN